MISNVETLLEIANKFDTLIEFYDHVALFSGETQSSKTRHGVKVLTIHSSKGLEFDYVFLPFWVSGTLPFAGFEQVEDIFAQLEEERRVAFVGMTRARKFVQLSFHQKRYFSNGSMMSVRQSEFIQ